MGGKGGGGGDGDFLLGGTCASLEIVTCKLGSDVVCVDAQSSYSLLLETALFFILHIGCSRCIELQAATAGKKKACTHNLCVQPRLDVEQC